MVVINKYFLIDQFPEKSKDTEEHPQTLWEFIETESLMFLFPCKKIRL